ncbi:Leucine-rich repeat (LRR) protein [Flavobacterium sp. 90]|uniref:leucine-rich repeat domain-containing protein n=1 Tax=unclassified Flavobacterium TaxID=196869 RepID=UPI000EB37E7D|nr:MULTISPECIES: hypothetical protein [unclassified Flavobacterium]RKR05355.1 Leucine-rich repeat (LRR) protein [Flavobacterium sp. 81]TCK56670.1 Leucine-rich repeat (LRR) protein [Flavobacterium sp. 90]
MLKTRGLILFFLMLVNYAFAQPGYVEVHKNLNDYSESEIRPGKQEHYFRCTFIIDSTTNLERLKLLSSFLSLTLVIDLPAIPKEFSAVEFDSLTDLNIRFGPNFVSLKEFSNIKAENLEDLTIRFDSNLQDLDGLQHLTNLKSLSIYNFRGKTLPDDFEKLTSLYSIRFDSSEIENIEALSKMEKLSRIYLKCEKLKNFPRFKLNNTIQDLDLYTGSGFNGFENISTLQNLKRLTILDGAMTKFPSNFGKDLERVSLYNLQLLEDVSELGKYQKLFAIRLTKTGLREFKGDFSSIKLSEFTISENDSLRSIEGLSTINSLEKIEIADLPSLDKIDFDMSKCRFKIITLSNLLNLKNIDGICSNTRLEYLSLFKTGIKDLPTNFYKLENLNNLYFGHNDQLEDISNLRDMKSLEKVVFYECNKLKRIPSSFSSNSHLVKLRLESMKSLIILDGISNLENLKTLDISSLNRSFSLPLDLEKSKKIEEITISGTDNISMIKNLKELRHLAFNGLSKIPASLYTNENLEVFELYQSSIKDLSSLIQFKKLKDLRLRHNSNLVKIPDLTKFKSLSKVDIVSNKKLRISKLYRNKYDWEFYDNAN